MSAGNRLLLETPERDACALAMTWTAVGAKGGAWLEVSGMG